ncbi:MAG: flagellar protein FlgN [Steroidobacteraceae bacterium]
MTSGISPAQCRDTFARILAEELAALTQLETLLQNEHGFLAGNDIEGLEAASAARQDCVGRLLKLGDERRDLCRMLGRNSDLAGQSALLSWCDPDGTLGPVLNEHARRSSTCREQNDRNGALVGARMARLNNMLGMMAGPGTTAVYGPSGLRASAAPGAGRLVAARA